MLLEIMLLGGAIAANNAAQQNVSAAEKCLTVDVMMGAHNFEPSSPKQQNQEGALPAPLPNNRSPAVLLPDCRPEPVKRRKRKSDYPMA